jgi:hypothetical protein
MLVQVAVVNNIAVLTAVQCLARGCTIPGNSIPMAVHVGVFCFRNHMWLCLPCRFTGADEAVALAEKAHKLFAKECTVKCGIKVRATANSINIRMWGHLANRTKP